MSLEEKIEDKQISDAIDEWMECWKKQKFPRGKTFTYTEWREFRDFYINNYPELPLLVAYKIYSLNEKFKSVQESETHRENSPTND